MRYVVLWCSLLLLSSRALAFTELEEVTNVNTPNPACNFGGVDLTALIKASGDYEGTDGTYQYKMNVCGTSNGGSGCTDKAWSICQYKDGGVIAGLGTFSGSQPTWSYIDPAKPAAGVKYFFDNGDKCYKSGGFIPRPVNVQFPCDPAGTASTVTVAEDTSTCTFTISLKTDKSCPGGGGGGGGSSGGLSGGSVFLIILVVVLPLYIGGGCLYKSRKLGTSGKESCPNIGFWSQIPGLVTDGCRYTMMMIRTGCKGKGGSYQQV